MGVEHGRAVVGQQTVDEGQRVDLHVTARVLVSVRAKNITIITTTL